MRSKFTINFRVADNQILSNGVIVTYIEEQRLSSIKMHLTLKTDFFVVTRVDELDVDISNGLDSIKSTSDQLIRVIPYIEEIPEIKKPMPHNDPNRYLRDLMKWKEEEELLRTYMLRDNYLSIIACGLIITDQDFCIEMGGISKTGKKKVFASLIPDRISLYLEYK